MKLKLWFSLCLLYCYLKEHEMPNRNFLRECSRWSIDARLHAIEAQAQEARAAQRDRVTMLVLGGLGGILLTVGVLAVYVWLMSG